MESRKTTLRATTVPMTSLVEIPKRIGKTIETGDDFQAHTSFNELLSKDHEEFEFEIPEMEEDPPNTVAPQPPLSAKHHWKSCLAPRD